MATSKSTKVFKCRLTNEGRFVLFNQMLKYQGTHLMWEHKKYFEELAVQTAAKGFHTESLKDNQSLFLAKLKELRWVNGYNDCTDKDFEALSNEWHNVVMELVDDFEADDMYDYDPNSEAIEINVASISDHFIDLERIIYYKA